jgi:superfamily II DNA or RNA helicase
MPIEVLKVNIPRYMMPSVQNLREYQTEAIERLQEEISLGTQRIILQLPTGAGKTIIAAELIKRAVQNGNRALFICDMLTLIEQTSEKFRHQGIPHGIIQANHLMTNPNLPVQVCSIQTLNRRDTPQANLVLIDEVHCLHKAHIELMNRLPNAVVIGLSATPWTKGLGKYFSSLVVGATVSKLIEEGYLVDTTVFAPFRPSLKGIKIVAGDYQKKQLADRVNSKVLIGRLVEHWLRYGEDRQTIAFAVNIAHSRHIAAVFNDTGIPAAHIDGYMSSPTAKLQRQEIIKQFKAGEIRILSSVGVLSKGFDYPGATCMIWARPTRSLILAIQMLGRAVRPFSAKTDAIIIDHAGNTIRHGFITDSLPDQLDNGSEDVAARKRANPTPVKCRSCGVMRTPGQRCKRCGHEPPNEVIHTNENLVQVRRVKLRRVKPSKAEKQKFYSDLLRIRQEENYSDDWVRRCYSIRFRVSPRMLDSRVSDTVSPDTKRFIYSFCAGVRRRPLG